MSIKNKLNLVREKIDQMAIKSGRSPKDIKLVAVSKKISIELVHEATMAEQIAFGENFVQEALGKIEKLRSSNIEWHFIGHLQKNKARFCPGNFQWIHSVDSISLMQKIEACCALRNKKMNVLIQVNLSGEENKSGIQEWDDILKVSENIMLTKCLKFRGLMTIPAPNLTEKKTRKIYENLRNWRDKLKQELNAPQITELSMGMSSDYHWAIMEGATIIRLGTAVFGARK